MDSIKTCKSPSDVPSGISLTKTTLAIFSANSWNRIVIEYKTINVKHKKKLNTSKEM